MAVRVSNEQSPAKTGCRITHWLEFVGDVHKIISTASTSLSVSPEYSVSQGVGLNRGRSPRRTMLEQYLQMFANLRTDKGRDRYPEITHELGSEQDKDLKLCYKS